MGYIANKSEPRFQILRKLEEYLRANPRIRFGQALHNLDINTFDGEGSRTGEISHLRDPFYDSDKEILNRIDNAGK